MARDTGESVDACRLRDGGTGDTGTAGAGPKTDLEVRATDRGMTVQAGSPDRADSWGSGFDLESMRGSVAEMGKDHAFCAPFLVYSPSPQTTRS